MRVSFSPIHSERGDAVERALRREAEVFVIRSGARLIEALRLAGGEHGLALRCTFRDIVRDPGMAPTSWPVPEVLDALATADPGLRCRTSGLKAALRGLLVRIDAEQDDFFLEAADPASAMFGDVA